MYGLAQQRTYTRNTFGRGAVVLKSRGAEPLELDAIAQHAPTVFAEAAHSSRSARYAYIPTRAVLQGLWDQGFRPFEVRVGGSKDEEKRAHTKHLIRLRQIDREPVRVRDGGVSVGDLINPEISLLNSHDGTSAYILATACERVRCLNGLTTGETFEQVRIPHKGEVIDQVIEGAFTVVEQFPRMVETFDQMAALQLTSGEQQAFARAALQLRWTPDDQGATTAPIEPELLNRVRRPGDEGADLWRTFNRVQEGIIRGGQRYEQRNPDTGRIVAHRHVSPVRSIDGDRALNRALFTLAEEMAKLKA